MIWIESLAPIENFKENLMLQMYKQLLSHNYIRSLRIEDIMDPISKIEWNMLNGGEVTINMLRNQWNLLHSDSKINGQQALTALNIPRLGDITSDKLSPLVKDIYGSIINNINQSETFKKIEKAVGQATLNSLIENKDKIKRLALILDRIEVPELLSNKGTVCITGKLSVKREVFERELKENGFTISNSVTKSTDYLITDDPLSTSSKSKNAEKYGVMKISEKAFRQEFNI